MTMVELQNFMNYLVTSSPHLGRATSAPTPFDNPKGSRVTKKRSFKGLEV
jgi:hypothetical protein